VSIKTTLKFEAIKSNGGAAIQEIAVLVGMTAMINFVIVRELSVTGCTFFCIAFEVCVCFCLLVIELLIFYLVGI